jgi:hypothetical protein
LALASRGPNATRSIETAHVHHATRRRGSGAARVACAAAGAGAADRLHHANSRARPASALNVLAFQKGLLERGLNVGQNVRIDYRFGVASVESISTAVADILATSPEVMLAHGTAVTAALQKQTQTVPVVFTVVSDPVGSGFIQSFARPGGNLTGFTNFLEPSMAAEWVELLKEIAPGVSRLGILFNPQLAAGVGMYFARPAEAPRSELRRSDYPLKVLPHRSGYQRVRARAERWADCATGHHNSAAS